MYDHDLSCTIYRYLAVSYRACMEVVVDEMQVRRSCDSFKLYSSSSGYEPTPFSDVRSDKADKMKPCAERKI